MAPDDAPATSTAPATPPTDPTDEGGGLATLWVVVGAFAVLTVARSLTLGIALRDPGGEFLRNRILITAGLGLLLAVLDAARRTRMRAEGWERVLPTLRERWTRRRLGVAVSLLAAYHLTYFCYHNLKSWNALNPVRDARLARVDRWLLGGHTPAALLHDVLGTHVAAWVLVVVYESFGTLVPLVVVAAVVLPRRRRDATAFVAALVWVWILGVGCYYLLPSLGPFHQSPQDFATLPHTIVTETQARYLHQRADFLAHPRVSGSFAQIGAFASLHVGVSTVVLLVCAVQRRRVLVRLLLPYVALTVVATVYLGWHFLVDDVAGLAIAALAVGLGELTTRGGRLRPRGA